jgi:MFS superfamily sulfate permease-like transporter
MIKSIFSYIDWPQGYGGTNLKKDVLAGLTVALVLIPQSMAYAELAGLPSYYGLYASFLPPMVAALFGSSRQLATGPVAVVSLLTATTLEPLATAGSSQYIAYAILLALLIGFFQFSLGALKLGLVVNFISHPVVNGFSNAAALIIATSQLPKLFGIQIDKAPHHYEMIYAVIKSVGHYIHWPTLFMAVLAFAIMYGLKRIGPRLPNVLVAVAVTTILSWVIGFEHNAVVDVSTIHSEQVKQKIEKFNRTLAPITLLTENRAQLIQDLKTGTDPEDMLAKLETRQAAERIALQIVKLKTDAGNHRRQLRRFLLEGVREDDGSVSFYAINESADRKNIDSLIWRLEVSNTPLQTDNLQLIGGGEVVGAIPRGLPSFSLPRIDYHIILHLLPYVVIIALLGFMEAISVAKAMAAKTGQRLDPNRELIGQGLANICGAVAKSYPISGSFSRSAVNLQSGAISGLSSVFTSLTVVVVLLVFTPLF